MSRSRRKTPSMGIAGGRRGSEKRDKTVAAKLVRAAVKQGLKAGRDDLPRHPREVLNPWSMAKDGKARFDPKKYPKSMRK